MRLPNFIYILLSCLIAYSCATIPTPVEENIKFPHTFKSVGYRSTYDQEYLLAFEHVADLIVGDDKLQLIDDNVNLDILYKYIKDIKFEKVYYIGPHKWVIISYNDGMDDKMALFTAFRYAGWVGGTSEIHEAIQLAYKRYLERENIHPN